MCDVLLIQFKTSYPQNILKCRKYCRKSFNFIFPAHALTSQARKVEILIFVNKQFVLCLRIKRKCCHMPFNRKNHMWQPKFTRRFKEFRKSSLVCISPLATMRRSSSLGRSSIPHYSSASKRSSSTSRSSVGGVGPLRVRNDDNPKVTASSSKTKRSSGYGFSGRPSVDYQKPVSYSDRMSFGQGKTPNKGYRNHIYIYK